MRHSRFVLSLLFVLIGLVPAHARSRSRRPEPPPSPFDTVVIDPGHGGHDRGGLPGLQIAEKEVALDVAQRLRTALNRAGFRTVMTRTDDRFVSLGERVAVARAHPDAIFVSIHFNAARRTGARGIETFYASGRSRPVAAGIQRQLVAVGHTRDRGVKHAGFHVLRENRLRAVLTECGFLTNPDDARLAQKSSYRQRLAEGLASAIQRYRASL